MFYNYEKSLQTYLNKRYLGLQNRAFSEEEQQDSNCVGNPVKHRRKQRNVKCELEKEREIDTSVSYPVLSIFFLANLS